MNISCISDSCRSVAIDATSFVDGRAPGFNSFILALLGGVANAWPDRIRITLFVLNDQYDSFRLFEARMHILRVRAQGPIARVLWQNFVFPFLKTEFDLVIFPANFAPFFHLRFKYILIVHDLNFLIYANNFGFTSYCFRRLNLGLSMRRASRCVAISDQVRSEILRYTNIRADVIHNAVKVITSSLPQDRYSYLRETEFLIIVPASIGSHKNVVEAYKSALVVAEKYEDVTFAFFGTWNVSDLAIIGESVRVHALGYLSEDVKSWLFTVCDAVLVPSIYEGFGIPYIEALQLNKALICCDIRIAREIAREYPYYISPPYSSVEISDTIEHSLKCRLARVTASTDFLAEFSPEVVAIKYLELICDVVGEGAERPTLGGVESAHH